MSLLTLQEFTSGGLGAPAASGGMLFTMEVFSQLVVMLAAGLIARHATIQIGRRLAQRSPVRIPALCTYATAGILAALARFAMDEWTSLTKVFIWIGFGAVWGVVAGFLLPFSRRPVTAERQG